jgi:phasin family protein
MTEAMFSYASVNPAAVDALVRANRAAAHGFEQIAKQCIDAARQSFEDGVLIQRRLAGAANLTDLATLQGQIAQEHWHAMLARSRAWSDLGTAIAREVMSSFNTALDAEPGVRPQKKAA